MAAPVLAGAELHLSRSVLPPDLIRALHDILRDSGATVNLCCNPSAHSPHQFHVLFSPDSDKSRELQAQGCQVVGPECVFQCIKARRALPRRPCTCCLALQGVSVYAAGGDDDSQLKSRVEWLVSSMCGNLDTSISPSTDVVIARSVLFPEQQLACRLNKPIVALSWLDLCSREHKLVPHEPHKLPALSGLAICATQVPVDVRKRIAEAANQYGASYCASLTKECTHLIAKVPEGEKYVASKSWGTIKIVNQNWMWQSVSQKVRLDEELFPVPVQTREFDVEGAYVPEDAVAMNEWSELPLRADEADRKVESSWTEGDSYLANCRVYLVGFSAGDMKRLVDIVLDGGGTRYTELNRTVTHIVLGCASESELKSIQRTTAGGAVQLVNSAWLDECLQERQELDVNSRHTPSQLLQESLNFDIPRQKPHRVQSCGATSESKELPKTISTGNIVVKQGIFTGVTFAFLGNFSQVQKAEITESIIAAGGSFEVSYQNANYLIGCHDSHGVTLPNGNVDLVSIHWLRQCLMEKKLLDSKEHILYRPLSCRLPLPGFENFKLCISQYEDKDRTLCRHLCCLLGAKFSDVLTKKVTHLLCKAGDGEKYRAAVLLNIPAVTIDWLYACVAQNAIVSLEGYRPNLVQCPSSSIRSSVEGGLQLVTTQSRPGRICSGKRKSTDIRSSDPIPVRKRPAECEGAFDAWDVLTACWSTSDPTTSKKQSAELDTKKNVADGRKASSGGDIEDSMTSQPDVAAAIESLLAQTTKVQEENLFAEEENYHELNSEAPPQVKQNLLLQHSNTGRTFEHESDPDVSSGGGDPLKEDSQIASQIVAYDEDHSGRQIIMERVRSASTMNVGFRRTHKSTKSFALGRLFQAAEANK